MAVEIPVIIDIEGAFADAAKRVDKASAPLRMTMEQLSRELSDDMKIMEMSQINTELFKEAAKDVQRITQAMELANDQFLKYSSNEGSLRRMNAELASLVRRWEEMGAEQKFTADGKLTDEAKKLKADYIAVTQEIQKSGRTLTQIAAEEQKILSLKNRGIQNRKYENAILNSTVKTLRVLQEKERILSDRLSTTQISTSKYRQLKKDLQDVRRELEGISVDVKENTVPAINKAESGLAKLVKRSLQLVAIHSASTFVRNIREVTAQFELQKVALGSIIQDTEKANALFKQIKAAAVESPFEIKDLVTYTKQLSAYQIETEKLFDTTMRLADISAGLGVDMGRLILAFGQVRAAAVLRGQELRQFTEAGIPLVDKLAEKFSQLNGRAVKTSEVFELISKRAVPFAMIEEIFNDLTSAGGAFYKMQEKQAETLLGQWNNLKDSISIMYDEIGNTTAVHNAMEGIISNSKVLMQNWRSIATVLKSVGVQYLGLKFVSLFLPTLVTNTKMLEKAEIAEARAKELSNRAHRTGNKILSISSKTMRSYAYYTLRAARSSTQFGRSLNTIKATLTGNWPMILISVLTVLIGKFIAMRKEANRLNEELLNIEKEGGVKIEQTVRNFTRLAKTATSAVDGSKEQREALEELVRTYGDLLPPSDQVIDKLREMNGEYKSITDAIRQKINMQIQEQKMDEIVSEYGQKIGRKRDRVKKILKAQGLSTEEISAVMEQVEQAVKDGMITVGMTLEEKAKAVEDIIEKYTGKYIKITEAFYSRVAGTNEQVYRGERQTKLSRPIMALIKLYSEENDKITEVEDSMKGATGVIGKYAAEWKNLQKEVSKMPITGKADFEKNESKIDNYVKSAIGFLQKKFDENNLDISRALVNGKPNFNILSEITEELKDEKAKASLKSIVGDFKKEYQKLIPDDDLRNAIIDKLKEISGATGISMDKFRSYIKAADEDGEKYLKELGDSIESYRKEAEELSDLMQNYMPADTEDNEKRVTEYNNMADALQILYDYLSKIIKLQTTGRNAYQKDAFITLMENRIKFMQDFKRGYDDLRQYVGNSAALLKESGIMKDRGFSLDINEADQQKAAEGLSAWYQSQIDKVLEEMQEKGLGKQTLSEVLSRQITGDSNRAKMQRDYQKLLQTLFDAKTDFDVSQQKKNFEDALKRLADEIRRSEIARSFYQSILDLTGDQDLAETMSVDVYGGIGENFKENMQKQIAELLKDIDTKKFSAELNKALQDLDFKTILEHLDEIPEKVRSNFEKMAADSQKFQADQMTNWLKELQKAKTYAQKRVELAQKTEQRIAEINASNLRDDQKSTLLAQYAEKEAKDVAKLQYEVFKDSPMYVELFSNLDMASSNMLQHMRTNLVNLKSQWKDLDPDNLKEMQARLKEVDKQLGSRNPIKAMTDSLKEYNELRSSGRTRKEDEANLARASANALVQREILEMRRRDLAIEREQDGINSRDYKLAEDQLKKQEKITDEAIKAEQAAADQVAEWKHISDYLQNAADGIKEFGSDVSKALGGVQKMVDVFATDDVAEYFGIASDGINDLISGTGELAAGIALLSSGQVGAGLAATLAGVGDIISGTFGAEQKARIKAMDEEIERQDRLLSDLEYSYGRLDNAMKDAFGSEYVRMYAEEVQKLYAMQAAYEAQAQAERNKGKKADEDKVKDYEDKARETADRIKDMQAEVANFFAGTDLTSAAKDFATAWIEAYKQFGSTTDAMKEKFNEMIQSMVEQSLGAKIMQTILQPLFDEIDAMATEGAELSAREIAQIASEAPGYIEQINLAMTNLMNQLAAAGYNVRQQTGTFTGISRNIANASEESITGLAAGVNTQNFYMQHIDMNVAAILATLTGGTSTQGASTTGEYVDPYKDQMLQFVGSLPQMRDDLSQIRIMLDRVIKPKSVTTDYRVNI